MHRLLVYLQRPSISASLMLITFFLGPLLGFTVRYNATDDVGMTMMVGGFGLASKPSEYLMFSSIGVGHVLKILYEAWPAVPWYGSFLYFTLGCSLFLIFQKLLQRGLSPSLLWSWCAVFVVSIVIEPQFTIIASITTASGIIGICSQAPLNGSAVLHAKKLLPWILLAALGTLIRPHAAAMVWLLGVPLLSRWIWKTCLGRRCIPIAVMILIPILPAASLCFDEWYYNQNPKWQNFHEYNRALSNFVNRSRASINLIPESLRREIDWEPIDLSMLKGWFYADEKRYSLENLTRVNAHLPTSKFNVHFNSTALSNILLSSWSLWQLILLLFVLCTYRTERLFAAIFQSLWSFGVLTFIFISEYSPPQRVWFSLIAVSTLFQLFWVSSYPSGSAQYRLKLASLITYIYLVAFLMLHVPEWLEVSRNNYLRQQHAWKEIKTLNPQSKQLFVSWGSRFPYVDLVQPLNEHRAEWKTFHLAGLGTGNLHAPLQDRLREWEISDVYQALFERSDIFLIADAKQLNLYLQYIKKNYGYELQVRTHLTSGDYQVYSFRKAES